MDEALSDERLLLFIPCYNCQHQIPRVIAQAEAAAGRARMDLLIVDNGSRDDTARAATQALAAAAGLRGQVVRNRRNYGLGGSHKAAFAHAAREGYSHVVVLHGDDQGTLADLLPHLAAGAHRQVDALLGARFMPGSTTPGYSPVRLLGNHAFNALFSLVTRARVHDLGSGLNVFSRAVFADERVRRFSDDLRFNVFLLLGLTAWKRRMAFFPISWREEDQASNVRLVSQSLKTLQLAADYALGRGRLFARDHSGFGGDYGFEVLMRQEGRAPTRASAA